MKLAAICPVKNEAWILGLSARVALMWCDQLVCLNHGSTDKTQRILEELAFENPGKVIFADWHDEKWREMEQRQKLLDIARSYEATHIALIDADEVLCGDSLLYVRERVERLAPGDCLNVRMHCMWRGFHQYRVDPQSVWSNRQDLALAFCDAPRLEFAATAGYQHHARAPKGARTVKSPGLGVMHLQFANWRRLVAKHALYKVRERLDYPAKHVDAIDSLYNLALDERNLQVNPTPEGWLKPYAELMRYVDMRETPWQESAAQALVYQHGPETFAGLNLFGVVK